MKAGYILTALLSAVICLAALTHLGTAFSRTVGTAAESAQAVRLAPLRPTERRSVVTNVPLVGGSLHATLVSALANAGDFGKRIGSALRRGDTAASAGDLRAVSRELDSVYDELAELRRTDSPSYRSIESEPEFELVVQAIFEDAYQASQPETRTLREGALRTTIDAIEGDPNWARKARTIRERADIYIDSYRDSSIALTAMEAAELERNLQARLAYLPYLVDEEMRAVFLRAIDVDAARDTNSLWNKIGDSEAPYVVDEFVGGLGPSGAEATQQIKRQSPDSSVLAVDASERVFSDNFAQGGDAFLLNMTFRERIFGQPIGFGNDTNNAQITSPADPSDLSGGKWGPGRTWGESGAVASRASDADLMTGVRIISVTQDLSDNAPGAERIVLERRVGGQAERKEIWADRVHLFTGTGENNFFGDDATKDFLRAEYAAVNLDNADPRALPVAMSGRAALAYSEGDVAIARALFSVDATDPEARVAVIGFGDTSNTLNERILGRVTSGRWDETVQALGRRTGIDYVVSDDGPRSPLEFLLDPEGRGRYLFSYTAMTRGLRKWLEDGGLSGATTWRGFFRSIFPTRRSAADVQASVDQVGRAYQQALVNQTVASEPESIRLLATRAISAEPVTRKNGKPGVRVTYRNEAGQEFSEVYARIFVNTGYTSEPQKIIRNIPNLLDDQNPLKEGLFEVVTSSGRVLSEEEIGVSADAVAQKVPGREVYVRGVAALQWKDKQLIPASQLDDVKENNAAAVLWGETIRNGIAGLRRRGKLGTARTPVRPDARPTYQLQALSRSVPGGSIDLGGATGLSPRELLMLAPRGNLDLALRAQLADAFAPLRTPANFKQNFAGPVRFTFERRGGAIEWSHNLDNRVGAPYADELSGNDLLGRTLAELMPEKGDAHSGSPRKLVVEFLTRDAERVPEGQPLGIDLRTLRWFWE